MSNAQAIAAVTVTLDALLSRGLNVDVSVKPLDLANKDTGERVNLFLYQTSINAAWRNQDMPRQVKPGETGQPPLPLCLYYLVTAYGDDEMKTHQLLGKAMNVLHDHTLLGAQEIKNATETDMSESNLHEQIERVRITPHPLSLEEMSKLWTMFQAQYRISAAYEVSVVLIESTRPARAPLPVLARGKDDTGARSLVGGVPSLADIRVPLSGAFVAAGAPTLQDLQLAKTLPGAQLDDEVALLGEGLTGDSVRVVFEHQANHRTFEPKILHRSSEFIVVKLPSPTDALAATLSAGFYLVTAITQRTGEPERHSNSLSFALAPTITFTPPNAPPGNIQLTVNVVPPIQPAQRAALLFHGGELVAPVDTAARSSLVFALANVPAGQPGEYVVRLRVDGVDSIPIDRTSALPRFADNQILKVP